MRILREGIRATARLPEVNENMMLVSFSLFFCLVESILDLVFFFPILDRFMLFFFCEMYWQIQTVLFNCVYSIFPSYSYFSRPLIPSPTK